MKIVFNTANPATDWKVDYRGSIRFVAANTHRYLNTVWCESDDGILWIVPQCKEVYIDSKSNELTISCWD